MSIKTRLDALEARKLAATPPEPVAVVIAHEGETDAQATARAQATRCQPTKETIVVQRMCCALPEPTASYLEAVV